MSVSAGIVGLPNVGKSTIFNAITKAGADSANYPFCTIEPNVGIVSVPDARLQTINTFMPTDKIIPAVVEIVDIAGLVKGASTGEGLGNQFLANIREVDAILHVVRCFADDDVVHVEGSVDPERDVDIIETELILSDLQTVEKRMSKQRRAAKGGDVIEKARFAALEKVFDILNEGLSARTGSFTESEQPYVDEFQLITIKPVLYVANVGEDDVNGESEFVTILKKIAIDRKAEIVMVCGSIESELVELEDDERDEMLEGLGIKEPSLNLLVRASYKLLGLQSYFTAGPKEIRAWTIPVGAKAPQAAAVIHTDFEKHFIRAEVFSVDQLEEFGSEAAVKQAGKTRVEGKEYVMNDGDIVHFRTSA